MKPLVIKNIRSMKEISGSSNRITGFVPTMGYLHKGHLSLIEEARENCQQVVVSIFVNPAQFSPDEDLDTYPRNLERDYELLADVKVDYIFLPSGAEMYPPHYNTWIQVKGITDILCGASRPGHFQGVATIVMKLVNIVRPHFMYMGEKDFQQVAVLKRMLKDLNSDTVIVPCPLIRESDGLAMSSRNKYLDEKQRKDSLCLYKAIIKAREMVASGIYRPQNILPELHKIIAHHNGKIDYLQIRQSNDLTESKSIDNLSRLFLAVYIGKTRLIDNALLIT